MKNKGKKKRMTMKERKRQLLKSGMNIEAIMLNTEKYILESGIFPGLAEDIKMRRKHEPQKRLFRKEAAYISR